MPIRTVSAGRGLSWLSESLDMAGKRPAAVLGAALLAIVTALAATIAGAILLMPGQEGAASVGQGVARLIPLMILVIALQPVLMAGLISVIARVDHGESAGATGVFAGFGGGRLLPLASLGLIQVASIGLNLVLLDWLGGDDFLARYGAFLDALSPGQGFDPAAVPQPENAGLLSLANLTINVLSMALLALSVPQVMLAGRTPLAAVRDAFGSTMRNLPALLVALVVGFLGLFLGMLVVGLVATLAGLVGGLIAPIIGNLLSFGILLLGTLAAVAMLAGATYLAWRDTLADPAANDDDSPPQVQAEF